MTKVSLFHQHSDTVLYTSEFTYFREPSGRWEDQPAQGSVLYRLDKGDKMVEENFIIMCDFGQVQVAARISGRLIRCPVDRLVTSTVVGPTVFAHPPTLSLHMQYSI